MLLYKTARIKKEWAEGMPLRPLRFITLAAMGFSEYMWGFDTTITCIFRTEEEEVAVGAKSRTHKELRGIDFSVYLYEPGPDGIARPVYNAAGKRIRLYTAAHQKALKHFVESTLSAGQTIFYIVDHGTEAHTHGQIPRSHAVGLRFR
jgi:hypothetical protein